MEKMLEDCGGLKPLMPTKKELDRIKDKKKSTAAKKSTSAGKKK